jgi:hypothetical protein
MQYLADAFARTLAPGGIPGPAKPAAGQPNCEACSRISYNNLFDILRAMNVRIDRAIALSALPNTAACA